MSPAYTWHRQFEGLVSYTLDEGEEAEKNDKTVLMQCFLLYFDLLTIDYIHDYITIRINSLHPHSPS